MSMKKMIPSGVKEKVFKKTIYLEWGSWMIYVPASAQLDVDWSGKILVQNGRLSNPMFVKYYGLYGAYMEKRIPVLRPEWNWRPIQQQQQLRNNLMGGFVFTVAGSENCEIVIDTKAVKAVFRLGEIIQKKELVFHVGGKYSCKDLKVRLDGYNPFRLQKDEVAETARRENVYQELFLPNDFSNVSARRMWFRMNTVWFDAHQAGGIHFQVDKRRLADKHFRLYARIQATAVHYGNDFPKPSYQVEEIVSTCLPCPPYIVPPKLPPLALPLIIKCNGHIIRRERRICGNVYGVPLLEEIEFQIDRAYLSSDNILTIGHDNPSVYLIISYLLLGEDRSGAEPIHKLDRLPQHSDIVYCGFDTVLLLPERFKGVLDYMHRTQMCNCVYFVIEGKVPDERWIQWAKIMKKHSIAAIPYYNKKSLAVFLRMKKILGKLFLGALHQERDGDLCGYRHTPQVKEFHFNNATMQAAEKNYILCLKWYFRNALKLKGKIPIAATFSAVGHRCGYRAGTSLALAQLNKTHNMLLLADARGAAKEFGKKRWGCHIAEGAHKNPAGKTDLRMWWLSLYVSYFSGASILYNEESLWRNWHEHPYSQNDYLPRMRQEILREFHRFTRIHERKGDKKVDFAFLLGKYSCDCTDLGNNARVWGTFGGIDDRWNYKEPEFGFQLVDLFYPQAWTQSLYQKPDNIRYWWSGTPCGEFDFISAEAALDLMRQYKFIVIPGWNTMTPQIYNKLKAYVRNGGELFMSVPQMTTRIDRAFLDDMDDLRLIKAGHVADLCGVRIEGKGKEVEEIIVSRKQGDKTQMRKVYPVSRKHSAVDHPVIHAAKIRRGGAGIIAQDGKGQPILIENRVGKGKLYLLTTYNYQGNIRIRNFISDFLRSKIKNRLTPFKLSGDVADVYYAYQYEKDTQTHRLYFINTDWTAERNVKHFNLEYNGHIIRLSVQEGLLKSVVIRDMLVVEHDELFLFVSKITKRQSQYSVSVRGDGIRKISYRFLDRVDRPAVHNFVFGDYGEEEIMLG